MADDAYGATVAKRRLSRRLAELRLASGHTANHICDILNWGRGKVGRFEANQWKRPEMSDIRDLLRIYGVDGADAEELEDLALRARVRPWWRDYTDIFENEFPGFENDALRIHVCMPLVVPGLLQTQDYAEAFMRAGPRPPAWRRRAMETRSRRQEILDRRRHSPASGRGDHRSLADVPLGDQGGAARADRASHRDERPAQRGAAHSAFC